MAQSFLAEPAMLPHYQAIYDQDWPTTATYGIPLGP